MAEHQHKWKTNMHLDGCHWYMTAAACECGATLTSTHERALAADLYGAVWSEPQYREVTRDEHGRFLPKGERHWEEIVCARCKELQAGAKVKHDLTVVAKDGTIEREQHAELDQEAA
jgi:hypothetical protein